MEKINVIIPTRNRLEKLQRCLESIPFKSGKVNIEITVVCDGDPKTAVELIENQRVDRVVYVKAHKGSVYARNLATQMTSDALVCTVDDMIFEKNAFSEAIKAMREHFPDDDGVIGFNRTDRDHSKMNITTGMYAGVALIGKTFLKRFPEKKLYYPGYFLFAAQELTNLAVKLCKIQMAKKANIYHYAPRKSGEWDKTHEEGRTYRIYDNELKTERKKKGLLWGESK